MYQHFNLITAWRVQQTRHMLFCKPSLETRSIQFRG
jgi:hypothetical protein